MAPTTLKLVVLAVHAAEVEPLAIILPGREASSRTKKTAGAMNTQLIKLLDHFCLKLLKNGNAPAI